MLTRNLYQRNKLTVDKYEETNFVRLAGKSAIVTGASGGIGLAIAAAFLREGAKVLLTDIQETEASRVLVEGAAAAKFQLLDVTRDEQWQAAVRTAITHFGSLDILINNAGASGAAWPDLLSLDGWQNLLNINATGTFLGIRNVAAEMTRNGKGAIVNISSIAAFVGMDQVHMGYPASKAASHLVTKAAAVQYGRAGIRVNSVHPGIMPAMQGSAKTRHLDPAARANFMARVPLGRIGQVEEVAYAVLFLASDEASYISGTELTVDGGMVAGV